MKNRDLTHQASIGESLDRPNGNVLGLARDILSLFEKFLKYQLIFRHHVFDTDEAAEYCRVSEETLRYHALRSRKLAFVKVSKDRLIFLKKDLDLFLENSREEGFRDH